MLRSLVPVIFLLWCIRIKKGKPKHLQDSSLTRLELCAALLLSKLLKWCCKLFDRSVDIHAFSNSQIVLSWLQSHPSLWKTLVANRTNALLECMISKQWHYINTKLYPADVVSKGILPNEIIYKNKSSSFMFIKINVV